MNTIYESFYIQNAKVGAILRIVGKDQLQTLTCFQIPGRQLVHLEHRFFFEESPFNWSRYVFTEHHDRRSTKVINRNRHIFDQKSKPIQAITDRTIPSYAEYLLIGELATGEAEQIEFDYLVDAEPYKPVLKATLQKSKKEETTLETGFETLATPVSLLIDNKMRNKYWIADGAIIKSDWQGGAKSYRARDLSQALTGLDAGIASIIQAFI